MATNTTPKEFKSKIVANKPGPKPKKVCLCGGTAVKKSMGGWACARCIQIESRYLGGGNVRSTSGKGWAPEFHQLPLP